MTRRTSHSVKPRSRAPPLLADFFNSTSSHGPFSPFSRQFHNIAWLRMVQYNSCETWRCLKIRHLLGSDRNSPGLWKDDQGWLGTENILPSSDRAREYSTVELFPQLFYNAGQPLFLPRDVDCLGKLFKTRNSSDMVLSSHWLFRLLAPRTVDSTPSVSDVCEFSWICAVILVKPSFSVRPLLTSPLMFTSPSVPRGSLPLPFLLLLVFASKPDTGSGAKTQNRRCGLTTKNELHLFGNSSRCLFNQQ